ncbi:MAG: hypothetical protein J6Y95_06000, partial [Lachnospiraceae bacterium]|nr:hypothetical protein [Lachnospiraceae bacterium]
MMGVDHLYPRVGTREMENEHVALKIAQSAAHQNGSPRLVCESLGGSYWDCTMERMKWIADWEYVLGVNQLIPHGFHYTIEGERKRDWPPSMFLQFTWWEQYGFFNDYMTRLSYAFTGGQHVAKLAVLYPMNSIWANYVPEKCDKISAAIEADFNFLADRLLRLHIDYEFLDEDVFADRSDIRDGKICILEEQYEMLLLPPCTHIKAKTLRKMEEFVSDGGKILGDALLPYKSIEGDGTDFTARMEKLFGADPSEIRKNFLASTCTRQELSVHKAGSGQTGFISGLGLKAASRVYQEEAAKNGTAPKEGESPDAKDPAVRMLKEAVLGFITPEIEITSDEVFCLHHKKDGRDIFFLINPTEEPQDFTVRFEGLRTPETWNLMTGEIRKVPVYTFTNGRTEMRAHLEPFGSELYAFAVGTETLHLMEAPFEVEEVELAASETCGADGCSGNEAYRKLKVRGIGRLTEDGELKAQMLPCGKEQGCTNGSLRFLPVRAKKPAEAISLGPEFDFRTDKPNSINTDHWKVTYCTPEDDVEAITTGRADLSDWFDMVMGAWEMQLPGERESEEYPVDLWYVTSVCAEIVPDDLLLMIDGFKGSRWTLYVNGREVTETPVRSYLDAEIRTVPMKGYFRRGENTVTVRLTVTKKSDGIVDILKVIGSFGVEKRKTETGEAESIVEVPKRIRLGDWTKGDYPYYSGTGWYGTTLNLSAEDLSRRLILKADPGRDVFLVRVNGKDAGTCLWKPYSVDLTAFLQEGENRIELGVVNTLMNLLESSRTPSGLFSAEILPYDVYEAEI